MPHLNLTTTPVRVPKSQYKEVRVVSTSDPSAKVRFSTSEAGVAEGLYLYTDEGYQFESDTVYVAVETGTAVLAVGDGA